MAAGSNPVGIPVESLKFQVLRLFQAKSSLTLRQLQNEDWLIRHISYDKDTVILKELAEYLLLRSDQADERIGEAEKANFRNGCPFTAQTSRSHIKRIFCPLL